MLNKFRYLPVMVGTLVVMGATFAGATPAVPDPSDTATDFFTDNIGEAVAVVLAVAGVIITFGLLKASIQYVTSAVKRLRA